VKVAHAPAPQQIKPPVLDFYEGEPLDDVLAREPESEEDEDEDEIKIISHTTAPPVSQPSASQVTTRSKMSHKVKKEPAPKKSASKKVPEIVLPPRTEIRVEGPVAPSDVPEPATPRTPRSKGKGKAKTKPSALAESPYQSSTFQTIPPVLLEGIASELNAAPFVSLNLLIQSSCC
jgi:hypothetical protein